MFTPGNEIWDNDSELANYTKLCGNGQKEVMIIGGSLSYPIGLKSLFCPKF